MHDAPRFTLRLAVRLALLYGGLVAFLTWPLAAHLTTHLPRSAPACAYDTLFTTWVLAHESRALVTPSVFFLDGNIYHPTSDTLLYGQTSLGALPYFMPIFLATGNPALAINLTFLVSVAFTAGALHLVVFGWTRSQLGGLVAAWSFLTTRWVLWEWLPTDPDSAVLQYFPFIIFFAAKPLTRTAETCRLLALVVLQCWTDVVYVAPAVLGPLGLIGVARLASRESRRSGVHLLSIVVIAFATLLPTYMAYQGIRAANPGIRQQTNWPLHFASVPTDLPWRHFGAFLSPTALPPVSLLLIAVGSLSLGLRRWNRVTSRRDEAWSHGALWAIVGMLMSLTPTVRWYGELVTLPHAALLKWAGLRVPSRLGVAALMALAILVGVAFAECLKRVPSHRARALVAVGLATLFILSSYAQYSRAVGIPSALGERKALPTRYPSAAAITSRSPLLRILEGPGGPVIELPLGRSWGGVRRQLTNPAFHARAMYRSIFHWRRLLNGYSSYWPAGFLERMKTAERLPEAGAVEALHRETGLDLVLVHADDYGQTKRDQWLSLGESRGSDTLRLVGRDGNNLLFRVHTPVVVPR